MIDIELRIQANHPRAGLDSGLHGAGGPAEADAGGRGQRTGGGGY